MKVSRNEACPCGSGKKFKACCGKGEKTRTGVMSGRVLAAIVSVVVLGGVAIAINQFRQTDLSLDPYAYDAKNDRYYDPVHGHMHEGRPPGGRGQGTQQPGGEDPQPWEYNAARNQHWDPGHGHWHEGPPPNQTGSLIPGPTPGAGGLPTLAPLGPAAAEVPGDGSPTAWDYDAENDTHWNPNTRTWDAGMPPLEAITT